MNYNDNEDELERMRARSRRGTGHRTGSIYAGSASTDRAIPSARRQIPQRRQPASGSRFRDNYDDEYYFDQEYDQEYSQEEYGQPNQRQINFNIMDDRKGYAYSKVNSAREVRKGSGSRSSRSSSRPQKSSRKASQAAPSGQRNRQRDNDIYTERNGRNRGASRRPGQGQMAKKRKKKSWKGILLILLAAFISYGAWLFIHRPTGIWNIAVFGVDSRDGNTKNALADVQMICSINRSTGEIKLVSVYRDTYLKINSEGSYHKINEAYFKGGQKQAVSALEENLDIKIDDYATFNWKSVAEAINILGGVDIDITQSEFKYINAFITETVNSTGIGSVQLSAPGPNHLDGVQAVAYSRLRLMDTDFQRTERQRKVVMLALEKAKQADVSTLTSLITYLTPQISTSVGLEDVLPLAKDIGKYHIGETAGFPFSRQNKRVGKMDCVIPTTLESNVVLLHQFLYGEETSYSPSSAVKKISSHISEKTGLYEEGKAAPSGGLSGGSSGGSSGSQTPAQTAPAETIPPETTPAEESTEESIEETIEAEMEPDDRNEPGETEEIGPGISTKPNKNPDTTKDETKETEYGPGAGGGTKPNEKPTEKPTMPPATEVPETPGPGGNSGGNGGAVPGVSPSSPGANFSSPVANPSAPGSNTSGPGEYGPGA